MFFDSIFLNLMAVTPERGNFNPSPNVCNEAATVPHGKRYGRDEYPVRLRVKCTPLMKVVELLCCSYLQWPYYWKRSLKGRTDE